MALVEQLPTGETSVGQRASTESCGASARSKSAAPAPSAQRRGVPERLALQRALARLRSPVWAPILLKALGIAALMLGLAGIGAFATLRGAKPGALSLPPAGSGPLGASWLASEATLTADPLSPASGRRSATDASTGAPANSATSTSSATAAPAAPAASGDPNGRSKAEAAAPSASAGLTSDGRVILNLASAAELRHLPGVGQKRAEAILALREKLGRFKRATDLLRVRGIGPRRLKQMLPKLVVDAPIPEGSASPPTVQGKQVVPGAAGAPRTAANAVAGAGGASATSAASSAAGAAGRPGGDERR